MGRLTDDLHAAPEPTALEPLPKWLREALLYVARLPAAQVDVLTVEKAHQLWLDHISEPGQ